MTYQEAVEALNNAQWYADDTVDDPLCCERWYWSDLSALHVIEITLTEGGVTIFRKKGPVRFFLGIDELMAFHAICNHYRIGKEKHGNSQG